MKKLQLFTGAILLALLLIFVMINLFDVEPDPGNFTTADLGPDYPGLDNSYYLLWALMEPPDVDITSNEVLRKYYRLAGPEGKREDHNRELSQKYRELRKYYWNKIDAIRSSFRKINFEGDPNKESLPREVQEQMAPRLDSLDPELIILLERFRACIHTPEYHEMVPLMILWPSDWFLPTLQISRLYILSAVHRAMKGGWMEETQNLLDLISFAKRGIKGSRTVLSNPFFRSMMRTSLIALNDLMNQPDCPREVFERIADGLNDLEAIEEYGYHKSLVFEALLYNEISEEHYLKKEKPEFFWKLVFHKNRSINRIHGLYRGIMEMEKTSPYQWDRKRLKYLFKAPPEKSLWWIQNMAGKLIMGIYWPSAKSLLFRCNQVKITYDLTRLAAELHLQSNGEKTVPGILAEMDAVRLLDPCSGKPYRWNENKRLLYSVGMDGNDQHGVFRSNFDSGDFSLKVVLR